MTSAYLRAVMVASLLPVTSALGQTYVPPGTPLDALQNGYKTYGNYGTYSSPRFFGYSYKDLNSTYAPLGWETTPRSILLNTPPPTGSPRWAATPNIGAFYQSMQVPAPYQPPTPAQRNVRGESNMLRYGVGNQPVYGTTRLLNPLPTTPSPYELSQPSPAGESIVPTQPLAVTPMMPAAPLEPLYTETPAEATPNAQQRPGFEIPKLGLPKLPWNRQQRNAEEAGANANAETAPERLRLSYAQRMDMRLQTGAGNQAEQPNEAGAGGQGPWQTGRGILPGERGNLPAERGNLPGTWAGTGPLVNNEANVYANMRARTGQLIRPLVPMQGQPGPLPEATAATGAPGQVTPGQAAPAVQPQAAPPTEVTLRSFVGTENSVLNKYLREGETELKAGHFARAADMYDMARAVDPSNPLPLLGRCMAKFASGDFMTSATNLFQAIDTFSDLARFRLDLKAFIPNVTVLDTRRAELERQLRTFDDFRLRFLLGYAEYCSGLEQLGVVDMTKAAQYAPPERTSVQKFVTTLKNRLMTRPTTTAPAAAR
jgi:hypothetical protein